MITEEATPIEALFEKAEDYSKTTFELLKLNAIDKSAALLSTLAAKLVITIVMSMFVLTFNIALALLLGEILGKSYIGFFVVSVFYLFVALLIYSYQDEWVKEPLSNAIISQLQNKN